MANVFSSNDLLKLGYEDDELLLGDVSLCTLCSYTCSSATSGRPG